MVPESSYMSYEFTDEYDSVDTIAEKVIEKTADSEDMSTDELSTIPVTAIDEAEMPRALEDPESLTQDEWDALRQQIIEAIHNKGYVVD